MSAQEITVQTEDGAPEVTFLKGEHELAKLLKRLGRSTDAAVKFLVDTLADEKADTKLRMECAKNLLTFHTSVAKQISDDEMSRLIAQVKLASGGKKVALNDATEKPEAARLNFDEIREIE